nr:hypothetical protein CFP56_63174 [Quercus suber]
MHNYYPSSLGNCFTKLMQIPSTKYAADSTEVIRIIIDKVYSLLRRARFKFDHAATFNATHLSSDSIKCLRKCQESSNAIVNYWYHRFEKDEFFPQIRSGTVHHFWRRARTHARRCLYGHNCSGDKAVRAFTHSVFDEIEALVRLGNALRNRVGNIRSMRLTEIKPMPLVVRRCDSIKGLQQCQKSADDLVNFWEDHLMNVKLFPEIPLGSVDQFWRQVLSHVEICFHQNDRADNVVKEFIIHSVFDEIDDLVRVGYAFKHKVQSFRSIRLTELKPTPLVVHHRRK